MKKLFSTVAFLAVLFFNAHAQYEISISNERISSEGFFFDVLIKSIDNDFLLGSYQCTFNFNNNLTNSGPLLFKYIESTSDLSNEPRSSSGILEDGSVLKLCFAAGAGRDVISSSPRRIGSFGLFGNITSKDSVNLKWSFEGNLVTIIADADFNDITSSPAHSDQQNPLPVELVSFKAIGSEGNITLKWETATELNSYGFEILRKKKDEQNFVSLGIVKSVGGNNNFYTFADRNILSAGLYTYKLKQIDNDGSIEYISSLDYEVKSPAKYALYQNYPNPFNPATKISYSLKEKSRVELKVFDITGKLIADIFDNVQESGNHQYDWVAGDFASGIFICQLRAVPIAGGEVYSSIIKMILLK